MTRLDIINELMNRGYEAQAQESIKNGITFEGIVIRSESAIAPVIYTDPIINESDTVEEAADKILRLYEAHSTAPFDVKVLKDPNWILEHITIGLQLNSNEPLVKRETEFEGIEQYLMLRGEIDDSSYSLKVTPELLSTADVDTEDAWREAMIHICRDTHLISLDKIMADMLGESDNFEILLFGVSVDNGPVIVYDLTAGDEVPTEILAALSNDAVTKWAFNASFERVCLSNWLRKHYPEYFKTYNSEGDPVQNYLNPSSWKCTMIWSAYMGLPLSLEGVGAVLKLQDQKMKEGKDLIKYFCCPCKPTKVNGGRTRNLPEHAPDKWETFKAYNRRDVEVELSIKQRLSKFPVPDSVWYEYHIDQEINDRGIMLDMDVVENAIAFDEKSKSSLMIAMQNITNLDNPNSVVQMKQWLSDNGVEAESLGKKDVAGLIKETDGDITEALKLMLLTNLLKDENDNTKTKTTVPLPTNIEGKNLTYKTVDSQPMRSFPILLLLLPFVLYEIGRQKQKEAYEKRNQQLISDYPNFVFELGLMVQCGLNVRTAWSRLTAEYEMTQSKCAGYKRYLFEEMLVTRNQIEAGESEAAAYGAFGRRCREHCYLRLGNSLEQNIRQGISGLEQMLDQELTQALDQRKNQALQEGERMETKMLFPMFLLLGLVMAILMIPAFMNM